MNCKRYSFIWFKFIGVYIWLTLQKAHKQTNDGRMNERMETVWKSKQIQWKFQYIRKNARRNQKNERIKKEKQQRYREKNITDYQPDENVVNPTRLIVIKRSSRRIFSFGKRNGRWANLHCGITCRKLTANNFCQFIFIYGWIKPMVVVSFLHISLRMSLDDVCLVMVMMMRMRMMIIKATLTHVSITIAITIVIKQCVLDFCLIIEYCLGYIAIWAHVFVRACVCVYVWYSCVSDLHVQKSPKCRDVLRFNKHRTKSFCSLSIC